MIIVRFYSGLGNQIYQYIIYLLLIKYYTDFEIKADLRAFEHDNVLNFSNGFDYGFALNKLFEINLNVASTKEAKSISNLFELPNFFYKNFPSLSKKIIYNPTLISLKRKINTILLDPYFGSHIYFPNYTNKFEQQI